MLIDPSRLTLAGFAIAFAAGAASFASPCVLPLVPGLLGWLAGGQVASPMGFRRTATRAAAFALGFGALLAVGGAGLGAASVLLDRLLPGPVIPLAAPGVAWPPRQVLVRVGSVLLGVLAGQLVRFAFGPDRLARTESPESGGATRDPATRTRDWPAAHVGLGNGWLTLFIAAAGILTWRLGSASAPERVLDGLMVGLAVSIGAAARSATAAQLTAAAALVDLARLAVPGSRADTLPTLAEVTLLGLAALWLARRRAPVGVRSSGFGPDEVGSAMSSGLASGAVGAVFAAGWSPCIGPNLSIILNMAVSRPHALSATALLAVYAIGLGLCFVVVAVLAAPILRRMARLTSGTTMLALFSAAALIGMSAVLLSGRLQTLASQGSWLGGWGGGL